MKANELANRYDQIAAWWNEEISKSNSGIEYVEKALNLLDQKGKALDIGCGGGRFIDRLKSKHAVTGIDVSKEMISIAKARHPDVTFINEDIYVWNTTEKFDVIIAWDSIFHAPYELQEPIISKMCALSRDGGMLLFTTGCVDGKVSGTMEGVAFEYASLDYKHYLKILEEQHCEIVLMEKDQYPLEHMVFMGQKVGR